MKTIRVWDPLVRLFHWSLALACVLNFWVLEEGEDWHEWVGYYAVAAVAVRILWGFAGTRYARFSDFFPTPDRVKSHMAAVLRGEHPQSIGHNPLGGLMILAILFLVLALGLSGWMMSLDVFWGDEWLEELHEAFSNTLMFLVFVHVAVVILHSKFGGDNLVKAMVTGNKVLSDDHADQSRH